MNRIRVEWICVKLAISFSRRHLRYLKIVLGVYLFHLISPRKGRYLRLGFFFLQTIDDYLDGDLFHSDVPGCVHQISAEFRAEAFGKSELALLGEAFNASVPDEQKGVIRGKVLQLIAVMETDYWRVVNREIWTAEQLEQQHELTFSLSLDLCCGVFEKEFTSAESTPAMIKGLGWCSTVRDFDEDFNRRLFNVPSTFLKPEDCHLTATEFKRRPVYTVWKKDINGLMRDDLAVIEVEVAKIRNRPVRKLLSVLSRDIHKYYKQEIMRGLV